MKNEIKVKIIQDSISDVGNRITTFQLRYHRYIHAEVMTHRVFSRSASSSRAIPIKTIIGQDWSNPATPKHWGANIPGMQAKTELTGWKLIQAKILWNLASKISCILAYLLYKIGLHKQIGNRILEPFSFINVIITSTDFENFFELRVHADAQPEIQELADKMQQAMLTNIPTLLGYDQWHLPYITETEKLSYPDDVLLKLSTARCARVSYSNHDGTNPNVEKDIDLHDKLVVSKPIHASPAEHQAYPLSNDSFCKNFRGWCQYRRILENEA